MSHTSKVQQIHQTVTLIRWQWKETWSWSRTTCENGLSHWSWTGCQKRVPFQLMGGEKSKQHDETGIWFSTGALQNLWGCTLKYFTLFEINADDQQKTVLNVSCWFLGCSKLQTRSLNPPVWTLNWSSTYPGPLWHQVNRSGQGGSQECVLLYPRGGHLGVTVKLQQLRHRSAFRSRHKVQKWCHKEN